VQTRRVDGRARGWVEKDDGEWVADCRVADEYVGALCEMLEDLEPDADTDWANHDDEPDPSRPEPGQIVHAPLHGIDPRTRRVMPGSSPLVEPVEWDAERDDPLQINRKREAAALFARLTFVAREAEADWNEARAAGDSERARGIRNFELRARYEYGVWFPRSVRRRLRQR